MGASERERGVCERIAERAGVLLDDLRLHVGIPTGMGHTAGLDETRERFTARCRALGAAIELVPGDSRPAWIGGPSSMAGGNAPTPPPTAICRRLGSAISGGGSAVLVAGHLDTVHDPRGAFNSLTMSADGRTATGPGCVDMKGGLVIAMAALEALEESGVSIPWTFTLNSDEETGTYHSDRVLRAEASSGRYSAGLALEPAMDGGKLAVSRGGSGQFMIECRGKAAHVGRDFSSGVSAVDALARTIVDAHTISDAARGVCVNVGPLWCPTPTNMVAPHAAAWGNLRFPDPQTGEALDHRLAELSHGTAEALPQVVVHRSLHRPAKPLTPGTQALAELARASAEDLGQTLPFGSTAGVCDGNNLQAAGLATIDTLGVRGGGLHTLQEWIEIPSLVERCQLLAVLMMRIAEGRLSDS